MYLYMDVRPHMFALGVRKNFIHTLLRKPDIGNTEKLTFISHKKRRIHKNRTF